MVKNISRSWNELGRTIGAGALAVAMAMLMVTIRYMCYFS